MTTSSEAESIRRALAELEQTVTVDQAAQLAGVHAATARRAFDRGQLEGARSPKFGRRILRTSAERWAAARLAA